MASLMYAQSTVKCDLCGNDLDENHFCLVCEETMCTTCKAIHNKGKATKDHEVVIRTHKNLDQTSPRVCSKHPGQMYTLCCEDCEEPVCTICITDTHKRHSLCQPSATVSVLKRKLSNEIDDMAKQVIPDIKRSIDMIRKQSDEHDQHVQKVRRGLHAEENMIKALFTEILDRYKKMESDLNDIEGRNQNVLKSKQKSMTDQLSDLQQNLALYNDKIACGDDFEFLKFMSTRSNLDHFKFKPQETPVVPPSFQTGSLSKEDIVKKLGMIVMSEQSGTDLAEATTQQRKSVTPTLLSSFRAQDKYIPWISTTHDGEAWVSRLGSCVLERYDKRGHVLVADNGKQCIDLLSEDGEFIQQLLTRENGLNQPYDLSVDDRYNLWVTMTGGPTVKVFKITE